MKPHGFLRVTRVLPFFLHRGQVEGIIFHYVHVFLLPRERLRIRRSSSSEKVSPVSLRLAKHLDTSITLRSACLVAAAGWGGGAGKGGAIRARPSRRSRARGCQARSLAILLPTRSSSSRRGCAPQTARGGASERARPGSAALAPAAARSPAICLRGPLALGHGEALPAHPLRPAPRPGRDAAEGAPGPRGRQSRTQPLRPQPHPAAAAAATAKTAGGGGGGEARGAWGILDFGGSR